MRSRLFFRFDCVRIELNLVAFFRQTASVEGQRDFRSVLESHARKLPDCSLILVDGLKRTEVQFETQGRWFTNSTIPFRGPRARMIPMTRSRRLRLSDRSEWRSDKLTNCRKL